MIALVFRDPAFLVLLLSLPVALWLGLRTGRPALPFPTLGLWSEGVPTTLRARLRWVPRLLSLLGLVLVVFALARPVRRTALPPEREGIDILLCVDLSSSMSSLDLDPQRTRLDVARDAAARFIQDRPDDRIGLIGFARYPDLRCPLTLDHDALTLLLRDLRTVTSDGPEDATGLGTAVARAAQVLQRSEAPSRVVIVFTDGEENVALRGRPGEIAPAHAAQLCERQGVRVYPIVAGRGRRDAEGRFVPIDTVPMEELADRSGGTFHLARDAQAVDAVYGAIRCRLGRPHVEQSLAFVGAAPLVGH